MATIQVNFFSEKLMRTTTFNAIVPFDKFTGQNIVQKPYKTLYLLHGIFGNYTDWISGTRIEAWAQERNLVVIMPSGENKFYVDHVASNDLFSSFILELVEKTRHLFPLSNQRADTYIGGLSMGGYGSIVNGLKYHETFGYICALSPALMRNIEKRFDKDHKNILTSRAYFESVFGDLKQLEGSEKDPKACIVKLLQAQKSIPNIYIACGKEDGLIDDVRDYVKFLEENHVNYTYVEDTGKHDWIFWDKYIKAVLDWLPLDHQNEGIHSGNVK